MSHRAAVSLIPLLAVASFLPAGCSSSGTGLANMPEPDLLIAQASSVADTARHEMGGLAVQLLVQITNNATQPITLKRVETQSIGLGAYSVSERSAEANSHPFDLLIPPSGTRTVSLWMSARANDTVNGLNGPVTLRMIANFDSAAGAFRSIVIRQVHDFPAPE
jgi:hypothetical protein